MARTKIQSTSRGRAYRQLWRVVDGAVADALAAHPDYLTKKGEISARASIVKRVTGAVLGYAEQSARGRSGASPAADQAVTGASSSWLARMRKSVRAWVGIEPPAHSNSGVSGR